MLQSNEVISRIEQAIQREINIRQSDIGDSMTSYEVGFLEGLDLADELIQSIVYEYEAILDSFEMEPAK